jgi:hypothetical protein
MNKFVKNLIVLIVAGYSSSLMAHEVPGYSSEAQFLPEVTEPYVSVADNIKAMDTDHDGIVTVHEMRVFMESKHGQGYEQKLFDAMEAAAGNRSCGSSFSKSLY